MNKREPADKIDMTSPESGPGWQKRRSDAAAQYFEGPSMTEQSHKDACDINVLMRSYEKDGTIPRGADGQPFFGDFSEVKDFHSAQIALIEAETAFMSLPARLRSEFDNDPGKLLQFMEDPKNKDRAIELGLIDKPSPSPAVPAPPVTTPEKGA